MKQRSSIPVIVVFVGFLAVIGIAAALLLIPSTHRYAEPSLAGAIPSAAINIDVYIDASGSMRNFLVNDGRTNTFQKFLSNCEFALMSGARQMGWGLDAVHFFKFGSKSGAKPLPKNGGLRDLANDPNQFNEPGTPIEAAINAEAATRVAPGKKKLLILVTDLFQSDGKLEKPASALIRTFLADKHGAVAIYGVRNPYAGPVEDVPNQNGASLQAAATSMPFYIIIAGENAADVRRVQEFLSGGGYGEPLRDALAERRLFAAVFSKDTGWDIRYPVIYDAHVLPPEKCNGLWCFSSRRALSVKHAQAGMAEPRGKNARSFSARLLSFTDDYLGRGIARMELKGNNSVVGLSWEDRHQPDDPVWQTTSPEGAWRVSATYCTAAKDGMCAGKPIADKKAADSIHVCNKADASGIAYCTTSCPEGEAVCKTGVMPQLAVLVANEGLTKGRNYLVEIDHIAGANDLGANFSESSELMHSWNLNSDEMYALLKTRTFPADKRIARDARPGKTPNLAQFLTAFIGAVTKADQKVSDGAVLSRNYFFVSAR